MSDNNSDSISEIYGENVFSSTQIIPTEILTMENDEHNAEENNNNENNAAKKNDENNAGENNNGNDAEGNNKNENNTEENNNNKNNKNPFLKELESSKIRFLNRSKDIDLQFRNDFSKWMEKYLSTKRQIDNPNNNFEWANEIHGENMLNSTQIVPNEILTKNNNAEENRIRNNAEKNNNETIAKDNNNNENIPEKNNNETIAKENNNNENIPKNPFLIELESSKLVYNNKCKKMDFQYRSDLCKWMEFYNISRKYNETLNKTFKALHRKINSFTSENFEIFNTILPVTSIIDNNWKNFSKVFQCYNETYEMKLKYCNNQLENNFSIILSIVKSQFNSDLASPIESTIKIELFNSNEPIENVVKTLDYKICNPLSKDFDECLIKFNHDELRMIGLWDKSCLLICKLRFV